MTNEYYSVYKGVGREGILKWFQRLLDPISQNTPIRINLDDLFHVHYLPLLPMHNTAH